MVNQVLLVALLAVSIRARRPHALQRAAAVVALDNLATLVHGGSTELVGTTVAGDLLGIDILGNLLGGYIAGLVGTVLRLGLVKEE